MLVIAGDWGVGTLIGMFLVPVLIGNMIGGTALFALISYAQVMEEI
jgi:formate/nitrite transporter FocA (FNT family)